MVNLLDNQLRLRDLRKLVQPHLHEVKWERSIDEISEWIIAPLKEQEQRQKLTSWLYSKNITDSFNAILVDIAWSDLAYIHWSALYSQPEKYFYQKHILVVTSDRSWVIEYVHSLEIIRFGRWVHAS